MVLSCTARFKVAAFANPSGCCSGIILPPHSGKHRNSMHESCRVGCCWVPLGPPGCGAGSIFVNHSLTFDGSQQTGGGRRLRSRDCLARERSWEAFYFLGSSGACELLILCPPFSPKGRSVLIDCSFFGLLWNSLFIADLVDAEELESETEIQLQIVHNIQLRAKQVSFVTFASLIELH